MSGFSSFLDLKPSPICLGTADLGSSVDKKTSFAMLDAYVESGGNFLDTAKVYADWLPGERSTSEKLLGEWMRSRNNRHEIIVATKGAHPDLDTMHIPRLSRLEIEADLHASLRHLQTDVIDIYWLHRDDPARPVEDILTTLNDAVKAGKIRCFGCSNWRLKRLRLANEYAATHGLAVFAGNQVMWNMAVIDAQAIGDPSIVVMDINFYEYHYATRLPVVSFSATANGFFQKLAKGGLSSLDPMLQKVYGSPANLARFERARQLAARRGLSITQVGLGYLLSQPFPTWPIVGPKTLAQLLDCLTSTKVHLEPAEIGFIESE
jgi:aryl-alcohol dehydrogenase-like predicted oxidoreductase